MRRQARRDGAEPSRAVCSDLIIALCKASQPGQALRVLQDMTAAQGALAHQGGVNPGRNPLLGQHASWSPDSLPARAGAPTSNAAALESPGACAAAAGQLGMDSAGRSIATAVRASGQAGVAGSAPVLQRPRTARPRPDAAQVGAVGLDGAAPDASAAAQGPSGLGAQPAQGEGVPAELPALARCAPQSLPALSAGGAVGRAPEPQGGALVQPREPVQAGPREPARAAGRRDAGQPRLPRRTRAVAARRAAVVPHLAAVGALVHAFACSGDLDTAFQLYQQARLYRMR